MGSNAHLAAKMVAAFEERFADARRAHVVRRCVVVRVEGLGCKLGLDRGRGTRVFPKFREQLASLSLRES